MVDTGQSLDRRQFLSTLAAGGVATVAGCGHPPVVLDMDEATADDVADEASTTVEPDSEEYAVVTSARENGSATRTGRYELFARTATETRRLTTPEAAGFRSPPVRGSRCPAAVRR